jgi:hypothetical protein
VLNESARPAKEHAVSRSQDDHSFLVGIRMLHPKLT